MLNTRTIATKTITEPPVLCDDKVIVKQKVSDNFVKTWYCRVMSIEEFEQFISDIETKKVVTLYLRRNDNAS